MSFKDKNIIFFDGNCNLCDRFVNYIFKRDKKSLFTYSPLQGEVAQALLDQDDIQELKNILFWKKGKIFRASDALFEIMKLLYPRGVLIFKILPKSFYKIFYRFVANNRYKFFGRKK